MKLLELLLSIVVLGLLAVISVRSFSAYRANQEMLFAVDLVSSAFGTARTQTIAGKAASQYGVHVGNTEVVLFRGTTYATSSMSNATSTFPSSVSVFGRSLSGGGADVVFKRLTGTTDQPGTVTLRSRNASIPNRTIQVLSTGVVTAQ